MATVGKITQVIGSTFDAQFPEEHLPEIYNAVESFVEVDGERMKLVGEVARHLGGGQVRCVALGSTDGLKRGDECTDTGTSVSVPVGERLLRSHALAPLSMPPPISKPAPMSGGPPLSP